MAEVIDIRGGDEQAVARAVTRAAAAIAAAPFAGAAGVEEAESLVHA